MKQTTMVDDSNNLQTYQPSQLLPHELKKYEKDQMLFNVDSDLLLFEPNEDPTDGLRNCEKDPINDGIIWCRIYLPTSSKKRKRKDLSPFSNSKISPVEMRQNSIEKLEKEIVKSG